MTEKLTTPVGYELKIKHDYNVSFRRENGNELVGKLDFNGPEMMFEGNAEESAKIFIDWLSLSFTGRLKEERNKALEEAAKECEGTNWYDRFECAAAIRGLK